MSRKPPPKATSYISINGAEPVPFRSLPEEERRKYARDMAQRMADELGRQLGRHPDIAKKLWDAGVLQPYDGPDNKTETA